MSDWVTTEVASALSIKKHAGTLSAGDRTQADETYRALRHDVFDVVQVRHSAFAEAAAFAGRAKLSLRSADALHLAIAAEHRARLCTRDLRQAQAAQRLGLDVLLLGDDLPE
ncbi:MAG: type II toxin-antitoxin system VapC family toxin [Nocardioidaceae bacterium]